MSTLEERLAALITSVGADIKAIQTSRALPSYVTPANAKYRYDPVNNLYNFKGSNTKRARAAMARVMGGGRMDILAIGDSTLIGFDGTNVKEARSVPRQIARSLCRMLGTTPAGSGMVAAAAYGTVGQSDHYTYTGTYTLTVGVMTMYAASTATFQSEQAGTIVDVYYSDLSQSFTVSIDGAAAVTVPAGGGTNAIKRYRVTGLADTTHSVKVTASTNWTYLCAIAVNRAAGVAVHNIAWGGGRAAGGGTGLSWTDTSAAANIQAFRKGAMDVSGYTPDLVVVSLGANDVNANDTPANIIAALTTIKGWYPNSDYLFMLWPGISTMAAGAWDAFCAALYSFADTQDIPIMDFRDRSGTVTEALALGLIGADNIHPTEGTQREWGRIIASAYAGSGVSPVLATPSGATAATDVPEGTVLVEYTTP